MKMTVEIADDLHARAREVARREGTTLRALIEDGLRAVLARREEVTPYRWPDLSVAGEGLDPQIEEGSWKSGDRHARFLIGSFPPRLPFVRAFPAALSASG
jgi:hypothetical protein